MTKILLKLLSNKTNLRMENYKYEWNIFSTDGL